MQPYFRDGALRVAFLLGAVTAAGIWDRATQELATASPAPRASAADQTAPPASTIGTEGSSSAPEEEERHRLLRRDIETLRRGIERLAGAEQGVLGDLKILESEELKRQAELAEAEERLQRTEEEEALLVTQREELVHLLSRLRQEVSQRLNALYRLGRPRYARVLLASANPGEILSAYRTAAALSNRDARLMVQYREESQRARSEAVRLAELRPRLALDREERRRAAENARLALERKRALLRSVHSDRQTHLSALSELEGAERSIGQLTAGFPAPESPRIGFDRFRGLLDWPAAGPVTATFGRSVNKKFGTTLVHSGLDIDSPFGSPIRSIQDGTVVFSQWLRGYGLTAIVDHGGGWLSVYAHASVLAVQKGERVGRGQKIAFVGDTGSLRGPYLYFEIRKDGHPVDPADWLRSR